MIGNVAQFWRLTRELDLGTIRAQFEREPSIGILGTDREAAERVARLVHADRDSHDLMVSTLDDWFAGGRSRRVADVYVVGIGPAPSSQARRALTELAIGQSPILVVQIDGTADIMVLGLPEERVLTLDRGSDATAREKIIGSLVQIAPEAMLPLGRRNQEARDVIATHLIRDASRVNAQFAALSSLPASLPLVGGLVGGAADVLVLTKNQVVLLFKLAGLYGRNLELRTKLFVEIIPVVGSAFLWRSAARTLVGMLPTAVSLLPKAVVAYTGTYVVGESARFYYQQGRRPSPELVRDIGAEGMRLARAAVARIRPGRDRPELLPGTDDVRPSRET